MYLPDHLHRCQAPQVLISVGRVELEGPSRHPGEKAERSPSLPHGDMCLRSFARRGCKLPVPGVSTRRFDHKLPKDMVAVTNDGRVAE